MLHEILLSLSGHPSALFDAKGPEADDVNDAFPLLSAPEHALLATIGRLSRLHRQVRDHAATISSSHPSTICRAVATAITTLHLARFQQKILDVEERVLKKDATSVGAYNIVPLAGVVGEFDEWTRVMEWYWQLVCFVQPVNPAVSSSTCSGSNVIDRLRQEAQTGFPDLEEAALGLGKVAETAWLRQLSTWVLYGRLPAFGGQDFFIRQVEDAESNIPEFEASNKLLPKFVSADTASSILFIGKSLNHIRLRGTGHNAAAVKTASELDLLPIHLQYLSDLALPISSSALSRAISEIRLSLSRNTLQQLLPLSKIIQILVLLREFFLLGRGEFAVSLINEADERLKARNRNSAAKPSENLRGILIKEPELVAVLLKTFATLSSYIDDDEAVDESLDLARSLIHLTLAKPTPTRPSTPGRAKAAENLPRLSPTAFNDFLLPTPTTLTLDIHSPFDLFITPSELNVYSALQNYLLSIRRAHMRLADLWRQTLLRRSHPAPLGPPFSCSNQGQALLKTRRERATIRNAEMRAVWATCSAAIFLLSETGNYFEGEVVDESWQHLHDWITQKPPSRPSSSSHTAGTSSFRSSAISNLSGSLHTLHLARSSHQQPSHLDTSVSEENTARPAPHDPESLSTAHHTFLTNLSHALLLTDIPFTTSLRQLLQQIDALVALLHSLQHIQSNLDLEEDEGVMDALRDYRSEEESMKREVDRARKRVDAALKGVVGRLREIEGSSSAAGVGVGVSAAGAKEGSYQPLRGAGVERLLMKLEGGNGSEEGEGSERDDYEGD